MKHNLQKLWLKNFQRAQSGSFAVNFAIIVPVLLSLAAGGLDFTAYNQQKAAMQAAADAAAVAAVKEASLKGWSSTIADSIASSVVDSNYSPTNAGTNYHKTATFADEKNRRITVTVTQDHYPYFLATIFPSPQITVDATATAAGSSNICVIGLDQKRSGTVQLDDSAVLSAPDCAVYSNSDASDGISALQFSKLTAELTCSVGGTESGSGNFANDPVSNCPSVADPLASRPAPSYSPVCDHSSLLIDGVASVVTLTPGVYCNGLTIKDTKVVFAPGVYVMKDGPLNLKANADAIAKGVGFYFTGSNASFALESGSAIEMTAPKSGPLAGLMFFQDRNAPETDFLLFSNRASTMVGTVYLPNGNFIIDTVSPVADKSAYTAIVTRTLTMQRKPTVVLNTDYGATDVPVPAGIGGPKKGEVRLLN